MGRSEIIALIAAKATQHGLVPYEFLGGAIAESNLNPLAWRQGTWPDWSAGLFQQTIAYADEGDGTASPDNVEYVKPFYFDPSHACDVAAAKFKHWRYDPEVSALQAWCAYNLPASYKMWPNVPNVEQRENYRAGLAQAQQILGASPMPSTLTYNPDAPVDIQADDFSCSEQSAQWLLRAIGRAPGDAWIRGQMMNATPPLMTAEYGLMDASGASLAAWMQREYGDEMGLHFTSKNGASWEDMAAIAGRQPMMIGGRSWGHWSGVRRLQAGGLELANPAPNWRDVGLLLDRAEFDRWGSWSYVTVTGAEAAPPPPPADPRDAKIAELEATVASLRNDLADRNSKLGYASVDVAGAVEAAASSLRGLKP